HQPARIRIEVRLPLHLLLNRPTQLLAVRPPHLTKCLHRAVDIPVMKVELKHRVDDGPQRARPRRILPRPLEAVAHHIRGRAHRDVLERRRTDYDVSLAVDHGFLVTSAQRESMHSMTTYNSKPVANVVCPASLSKNATP